MRGSERTRHTRPRREGRGEERLTVTGCSRTSAVATVAACALVRHCWEMTGRTSRPATVRSIASGRRRNTPASAHLEIFRLYRGGRAFLWTFREES